MWGKDGVFLPFLLNVYHEAHKADSEIIHFLRNSVSLPQMLGIYPMMTEVYKTLQHGASPGYMVWVESSTILFLAIAQFLECQRMRFLHSDQM